MDPLSALGVAASVMQFVQFGSSLVSRSRQIYTQGALLDHTECGRAASRLQELADQLIAHFNELESLGTLSSDSKALQAICARCLELSTELLSRLSALKVDEKQKSRGWKSFRHALKSVCSKDKIDGIAGKLLACREELNIHLITCIKYKADALALAQEETVAALTRHSENAQHSIQTLIESRNMLQQSLEEHREAINQPGLEHQRNMQPSLLSSLGETQWVEIRLVQSLRFSSMNDRHFEIPEAHQRTFRWIFSASQEINGGWSNFVEWLERGKGLYWINGKAGSGKSTLMRFIVDTQRTHGHLETWAKEVQLEFAAFFFWNTGSPDQRSQVGLFRSLLYQALHKRPDLVRHMFPSQWAEQSSALSLDRPLDVVWSLPVLKDAFKRWIDFAPAATKYCFFIDGLDEYEGDKEEMAEFFKTISSSSMPHVKICVSGRPLVEFDEAFEGLPGLRLQDLTFPDITAYVEEELSNHRRMRFLAEAQRAPLISEIVDKAAGVFLWVTLVVRSLLNGLRNRDGIDDLRRRVRELPSGLSALYSHMMNNVERLYQEQASQTFQIYDAMANVGPVASLHLQLAISATPQSIGSTSWSHIKDDEVMLRCERLDVHLKTRCGGLLEVYETEFEPLAKVNYLHRTVKEFLDTDEVRSLILSTGGQDFSPHSSVMMSFIIIMKKSLEFFRPIYTRSIRVGANMWTCIRPAFDYAREAESSGDRSYIPALEELERTAIHRWKLEYADSGKDWREAEVFDTWRIFREALSYGLASYVEKKLDKNASLISGWQGIPLLFHALDTSKCRPSPYAEIIDLLLRHGEDPNQHWNGRSPWQEALTIVHARSIDTFCWNWILIFKLFLNSGASPLEACSCGSCGNKGDHKIRDVILDALDYDLPPEAEELMSFLEEKTRAYQQAHSVL